MLPRSGFIHTVHHGKRTEKEADIFVNEIKQASDGEAPLYLSDGWKYEQVLKNNYCHYEAVPYSGRGRPRTPVQVVDPQLKYAQVIKRKEGNKLVEIEKRVVLGNEEEILSIIRGEGRGNTINTSYVESRNGNYRKDNKPRLSGVVVNVTRKNRNFMMPKLIGLRLFIILSMKLWHFGNVSIPMPTDLKLNIKSSLRQW